MPGYKPFKMKMKSYGQGKSPMDMGHAKAPNKFLGGLIGKAKQMGGKMLKGKDGNEILDGGEGDEMTDPEGNRFGPAGSRPRSGERERLG